MILFLTLIVTVAVWFFWRKYQSTWRHSEKFPGKPTVPLLGNAHQMGNNPYCKHQNLYLYILCSFVRNNIGVK